MASLRDKLPSMNLLVTFDEVARHLSFKKAGESSISREKSGRA